MEPDEDSSNRDGSPGAVNGDSKAIRRRTRRLGSDEDDDDEEEEADDDLNKADYSAVASMYKILGNTRQDVTQQLERFADDVRIPSELKVTL